MRPGPVSFGPVSFGTGGMQDPLSGPPTYPHDSSFLRLGPSVLVQVPVVKGYFTGTVALSSGRPLMRVAVQSMYLWRSSAVSNGSSQVGNSPPIELVGFGLNGSFESLTFVSSLLLIKLGRVLRVLRFVKRQCMEVVLTSIKYGRRLLAVDYLVWLFAVPVFLSCFR